MNRVIVACSLCPKAGEWRRRGWLEEKTMCSYREMGEALRTEILQPGTLLRTEILQPGTLIQKRSRGHVNLVIHSIPAAHNYDKRPSPPPRPGIQSTIYM